MILIGTEQFIYGKNYYRLLLDFFIAFQGENRSSFPTKIGWDVIVKWHTLFKSNLHQSAMGVIEVYEIPAENMHTCMVLRNA